MNPRAPSIVRWYKVLASTSDAPGSAKVQRLISVYTTGIHIYEETGDGQPQPKRDVTWVEMNSIGYKNTVFNISLRNGRDIFFGTRSTKITGNLYKTCKAVHKKYLRGLPRRASIGSVGELDQLANTVSVVSGPAASVTSTETRGEYIVTPVKPLEKETPVITDKREEKLISVKDETPIIDKNEEPAVLVKEVKVLQTDDKSDLEKYFFAFVVLCAAIFVVYVARSILNIS